PCFGSTKDLPWPHGKPKCVAFRYVSPIPDSPTTLKFLTSKKPVTPLVLWVFRASGNCLPSGFENLNTLCTLESYDTVFILCHVVTYFVIVSYSTKEDKDNN
ncbi:hypothetical protein SFRURICE_019738, partial [Spodoptera frugiperda]